MTQVCADIFGWDIGGAHLKLCQLRAGQVLEVAQWPCRLWLGLQHLEAALMAARQRWPALGHAAHAVTMTGEMVDLFADREDGVKRIAASLATQLGPAPDLLFYAGDAGWCGADAVAANWSAIASANWLASARHAALALSAAGHGDEGVLVDIGSTTTDLIAFRDGEVLTRARNDHQRLASGELAYLGVVRTPLCALARQLPWRGTMINVINEFFASVADVYRLTGELAPEHDQHDTADGAAKTEAASWQRLARMIGLDARDGSDADWLRLARACRAEQVAELRRQLVRVKAVHGLGPRATVVTAGCGDFLVPEIAGPGTRCLRYAQAVAPLAAGAAPGTAAWTQVCAPSVAVAALRWRDRHPVDADAAGRASRPARHVIAESR